MVLDVKLRLWKEYKRNTLTKTFQNRPEKVPENQWKMQERIPKTRKNIPSLMPVEERFFQEE
ncbi:hypothetical protein HID58_049463 [Brassica napus]|uniref:Uncharacterized protein n=1 Tax=Brassica napus TaxID=3708 RepID=A0ABQ8B558_BRANA|nr:hypothetical protein HID58_049463 [Brassica napus]